PMPRLTVLVSDVTYVLEVERGANLRRALLAAGISPHAPMTRRANCGGRGLCATCGVRILSPAPAPAHWHDQLAAYFGYPRLSCQITVSDDITVRIITDKLIWGRRETPPRA
ncbi:MAG: 2Fe-2S iron-sulfur cluster binding domain-containing protein, partial [Thermoflexales bacterium]|nr:2Fe-2S iron-sulfur cluster binding domain-containing protein [Thermoflexales bacterium]